MPSLDVLKQRMGKLTIGEAHKIESDKIMDATWWNDISSRVAYLYDWYHDDNKTQLDELHPETDMNKIPIDIKFLQHTSQTYDKDNVTFHVQFRPKQKCNVPYYDEFFKSRYNAIFPIGLYCDIQNEDGVYNRWLVVDKANLNVTQFPTFEVLRCDRVIQYVHKGVKYNVPGVLRSQNS